MDWNKQVDPFELDQWDDRTISRARLWAGRCVAVLLVLTAIGGQPTGQMGTNELLGFMLGAAGVAVLFMVGFARLLSTKLNNTQKAPS
jgi:hypothetical protein